MDKKISFVNVLSCLVCLLPLLFYNTPFLGITLATTILILLAILCICFAVKNSLSVLHFSFTALLACVLFGYMAIRCIGHNERIVVYICSLIIILFAIFNKLNISLMRKTIEFVSLISSILLIVQVILHIFGIDFTYIQKWMLTDALASQSYGQIIDSSIYRASSIFLEPAHFSQYVIFGLLSYFYHRKKKIFCILIVSTSIILSTSGIGIALLLACWVVFLFSIFRKRVSALFSLLLTAFVSLIAFTILMTNNTFAQSVYRIFGYGTSDNALKGRLLYWNLYVSPLDSSLSLLFGRGYDSFATVGGYATGLMECLHCYGVFGLFLLLFLFVVVNIKTKNAFIFLLSVCYCGLIPFSDVLGFSYITMILCFVCSARSKQKKSNTRAIEYEKNRNSYFLQR